MSNFFRNRKRWLISERKLIFSTILSIHVGSTLAFVELYRLPDKSQYRSWVWDLENWSVEHKQCLSSFRRTNVWRGTSILSTSRYWFLLVFLQNKDCCRILSVKITLLCWIFQITWLYLRRSYLIFFRNKKGKLTSERELIF